MPRASSAGGERTAGGGGIDKAGWYHFSVDSATEGEKSAELKLVVLAGDDPSQVGKKHTEFVNFFGNDADKQKTITSIMFNYAEALALSDSLHGGQPFTGEFRKRVVESGEDVELNFAEGEGRSFVAYVELEKYRGNDAEKKAKYEGRLLPRINPFKVFSPLAEEVKNVPRDPQWMQMLDPNWRQGQSASPPATPPTQAQRPAQSPAQRPAPQAAASINGGGGFDQF